MNKYVIKFSHVEESEYTVVVEAESYEEAMDIFEESPFDFLEDEEPDNVNGIDYYVSKVTENGEVVYENIKELIAEYRECQVISITSIIIMAKITIIVLLFIFFLFCLKIDSNSGKIRRLKKDVEDLKEAIRKLRDYRFKQKPKSKYQSG